MTISQPKSNEEEISLRVQAAIEKLDKVDADAEKEKRQIVRHLAKDLEGKIPTESICNEIVHQLRGKASPRLIRVSLDEKYKEKHRVENARKQKHHENTKDLAPSVPLNNGDIDQQKIEVVIDTSGNEIVGPQRSIIKRTDFNDNGNEATQNDSVVTSLNDEITPVNSLKEDLTDTKKKVLVSHIPVPFQNLRRDMAAVFQSTKGAGNVFFKVWVDLGTGEVKIEFCGITQHDTMISAGKGILKEAGTIFPLGS